MQNGAAQEIQLLLHDIRSAENVGAIFRTADAVAVSRIYLSGYTPAPLDRFGRRQGKLAKAALGAEESVSWEQRESPYLVIEKARADGFSIIAVEQNERAVLLSDWQPAEKALLMFGNEVDGIPPELLAASDIIVELPMVGTKESLNVSVAAGIVLYKARFN